MDDTTRSSTHPDRFNCYLDTYVRRGDRWLCVHACVWSLRELVLKGDRQ